MISMLSTGTTTVEPTRMLKSSLWKRPNVARVPNQINSVLSESTTEEPLLNSQDTFADLRTAYYCLFGALFVWLVTSCMVRTNDLTVMLQKTLDVIPRGLRIGALFQSRSYMLGVNSLELLTLMFM